MSATIAGIPVREGGTYHTIKNDVPRIVVSVTDGGTVYVRAPGGSTTWPVKHFARTYYRKTYRTASR